MPDIYDKLYDLGVRDNNFITVYINELFNSKEYDKSLKILNENKAIIPLSVYYRNKALLFDALKNMIAVYYILIL